MKTWHFKAEYVRDFGWAASRKFIWDAMVVKQNSSDVHNSHLTHREINKNKSNLDNRNVFIFGIKPTNPSSEYGYFLTKKDKKNAIFGLNQWFKPWFNHEKYRWS